MLNNYQAWGESNAARGNIDKAKTYYARALQIAEYLVMTLQNADVLPLHQRLQEAIVTISAPTPTPILPMPTPIAVIPTPIPISPPATPVPVLPTATPIPIIPRLMRALIFPLWMQWRRLLSKRGGRIDLCSFSRART